jgi:hypothetical protein
VRGSARDERIHRGEHDKTVNGPKIRLEDGIHFIDQYSTKARCLAAAAAASIARWENRYDFSPYDGYEQPSAFETLVLIRVHSRRVIGLVVLRKRQCCHSAAMDSFWADGRGAYWPATPKEEPPMRRPTVDLIWTLKSARRQGIALQLMESIQAREGCAISEFSFLMPFSEPGLAFVRTRGVERIYVCR